MANLGENILTQSELEDAARRISEGDILSEYDISEEPLSDSGSSYQKSDNQKCSDSEDSGYADREEALQAVILKPQ